MTHPPTKGHFSKCGAAQLRDTTCSGLGGKDNTQFAASLGQLNITGQVSSADTFFYLGINFIAKSAFTLQSVTIYPTAQIGSTYAISLRYYGNTLQTDTFQSTTINGAQVVPLNFTVPADSGYTLALTLNPGAIRDPASSGYVKETPQTIKIKEDGTNGFYNYFYNWKISSPAGIETVAKPAPSSLPSGNTTDGIKFTTYSRLIIDTLNIFPVTNSGNAFTIQLRKNGVVVQTANGTLDSNGVAQSVPVKFYIPTPGDYEIRFGTNPGVFSSVPAGLSTDYVPGVIKITNSTGPNGDYSYFYNIKVRYGYVKVYGSVMGDSVVDYPDTNNTQNIMDYSACTSDMFTKGQVARMRFAAASSIGNRDQLSSAANLSQTGALDPRPDLAVIADFTATKSFVCADGSSPVLFKNRSYNDTLDNSVFTFSNGATSPSFTTTNPDGFFTNSFTQPGWVTTSLTSTSNAGSSTIEKQLVYAADPTPTNPIGYFQEFNDAAENSRYPIFNYWNTSRRWEVVNYGFYDQKCIRYANYDNRQGIEVRLNPPTGDYADFFTPGFNLSVPELSGSSYLTFMTSGVFRTTNPDDQNDSLLIYYSTDCGASFKLLKGIGKNDLATSIYGLPYAPLSQQEWKQNSISLPAIAKQGLVFFRFRYIPGTTTDPMTAAYGTGNNFYLDRININSFSLDVDQQILAKKGIVLAPNPTSGNTTLSIKGGNSSTASIRVTDITGKLVYQTSIQVGLNGAQVEIPASALGVTGMYLVHVIADGINQTEKLMVQ